MTSGKVGCRGQGSEVRRSQGQIVSRPSVGQEGGETRTGSSIPRPR